jgi:hypothetical protein
MQGITKMHPFLSTNKTHTKKLKEKKKTLKKSHNEALAPIAGFLPMSVG